jgi:hypothetical protein
MDRMVSSSLQDLPSAMTHPGALQPHLQAPPHGQGDETDQDVGLHPVFKLMIDGAQAQIGFAGAKGIFHLGQLDIPVP